MQEPRRLFTAFWAIYFLLVAASNLSDALIALGWLYADAPFASGNFALIEEVTSIYGLPGWMNALFFAGVIVWEIALTALFAHAFRNAAGLQAAFGISAALWASFIVADELFIAYHVQGLETTHVGLLVLQCVTWLLCAERTGERRAT